MMDLDGGEDAEDEADDDDDDDMNDDHDTTPKAHRNPRNVTQGATVLELDKLQTRLGGVQCPCGAAMQYFAPKGR